MVRNACIPNVCHAKRLYFLQGLVGRRIGALLHDNAVLGAGLGRRAHLPQAGLAHRQFHRNGIERLVRAVVDPAKLTLRPIVGGK